MKVKQIPLGKTARSRLFVSCNSLCIQCGREYEPGLAGPRLSLFFRWAGQLFETVEMCFIWYFIFKYALIHQSDWQNGVVIKTYIARLISLPAYCVFYVTPQVCLKINTLSHARSWKYGKYSAIFFRIPLTLVWYLIMLYHPLMTCLFNTRGLKWMYYSNN